MTVPFRNTSLMEFSRIRIKFYSDSRKNPFQLPAGDGGAFSLVLPDSRSYDRARPCGPLRSCLAPTACCLARHGTAGRRPCKGARRRGFSASASGATENAHTRTPRPPAMVIAHADRGRVSAYISALRAHARAATWARSFSRRGPLRSRRQNRSRLRRSTKPSVWVARWETAGSFC
jgi:hypothetical protein